MTFNHDQLRGAYAAGFRDGQESLKREGWRKIESPDDVKSGDTVKLMVATAFSGWKGIAVVFLVHDGGLVLQRPGFAFDDPMGHVHACVHECLVRRSIE